MKDKLPCELIQDLFPSYIDGLTSEVTDKIIEEHIENCHPCKQILEEMQEELTELVEETDFEEEDKKEIDFLKKTKEENKKYTRKVFLQWLVSFTVFAFVWVMTKLFFVGGDLYMGAVDCKVEVKEEENQIFVEASTKEGDTRVISKVVYEEDGDGNIRLRFKAVQKSPFYNQEVFHSAYQAEGPIQEVSFATRVYWYHGEPVTETVSRVFNTCHNYVGDMSTNGETARALNMGEALGSFKNELQTSKEPYGWKIVLENEIPEEDRKEKERMMKAYAYILLAAVGNLGEVSYEYQVDGQRETLVVSTEEAADFAGRNIKECGQDLLLFQELMEDAKIYGRLYAVEGGW